MSAGLQAPLPDIQPGTLQHLELLHLASNMLSTLPASWGSRQDVLPSLQELYINMHISGPLPAAWSAGFQKLETLTIRQPGIRNQSSWAANGDGRWDQVRDSQSHAASAAVPELTDTSRVAASPSQRHLPPEWSTGFPVALVILLDNLNISGTFPTSWSTTGFPALARLSLQNNQLSGPLPSQLLASHKLLATVNVSCYGFQIPSLNPFLRCLLTCPFCLLSLLLNLPCSWPTIRSPEHCRRSGPSKRWGVVPFIICPPYYARASESL